MPDPSESGFIVVECQKAPNQNNKHVCVPKTWVTYKISEKRVAIAYPTDESQIPTRIKNKEPADNLWPFYIGDIKYEADSYENAVVGFLQTIRGESSKQVEDKNIESEPVAEPKNSLKVRTVLPKPKPKSEKKKKDKNKSPKKHSKEHSKNKIKKSKHKKLQLSLKQNIPDSEYITGIATSPDSVDDYVIIAPELSSPFVPHSNCQRNGLPNSLESKMDDIINSAPENYVNQLTNNLNNNDNIDLFERKLKSVADVMEKDIDFTNTNFSPEDKQLLIDAQTKMNGIFKFVKDVMEVLQKMYIETQETKKTLNHIVSKNNVQQTPSTVPEENENDINDQKNVISLLDESLQDEMDSEPDNEMEHEINIYEQNGKTFIIKEEDLFDEQDTDVDNISDNEIFTDGESSFEQPKSPSPDVKRKKKNSKKNNSWTLKHRHPGKGLVKLGRGVYINARGLEEAKQTSKNVRIFTRHLFREVFTQEALETCSMTGSKRTFGKYVGEVRPALHHHARTVIFNYAMKYCRDAGWDDVRLSDLVQSLRCMLQNNRRDRHKGRLIKS